MRKRTTWIPNRSDTIRTVYEQKNARALYLLDLESRGTYYPCSENKSADLFRSYCDADLRLCFRLRRFLVLWCSGSFCFPFRMPHFIILYILNDFVWRSIYVAWVNSACVWGSPMVLLVGNICTNCTNLIANGTVGKEIGANGKNGNTIGNNGTNGRIPNTRSIVPDETPQ